MRIRVDFTIDVPREALAALRELAGPVGTNEQAREFVKAEAQDVIMYYLNTNGVGAYVHHDATTPRCPSGGDRENRAAAGRGRCS